MSDKAYVPALPNCQVCGGPPHLAAYDLNLANVMLSASGRWGNVCEVFYEAAGRPPLGTGLGQRLIVGDEPVKSDADIRREIRAAINDDDFDSVEDLVGDRDLMEFL